MSFINRLLKVEDCEAAIALYDGAWSSETTGYTVDELKTMVQDGTQCLLYGTFDDNRLIAWSLSYDCFWWGYLEIFFVNPLYRKSGVGTCLLSYIKKECPPRWKYLETHILDGMEHFFRKHKFIVCDDKLTWGFWEVKNE